MNSEPYLIKKSKIEKFINAAMGFPGTKTAAEIVEAKNEK